MTASNESLPASAVLPAGAEIVVENPATGQRIGSVPATPPEMVRAMVARARAAQPDWEALGFETRGAILRRAQGWVIEHTDEIVATIVSETGKTHEDALVAEVAYAASAFGFWAKSAGRYLADEPVRTANPFVQGRKMVSRYRPVGVVGVIGPWNFPLTNSFGDCIPALAAGNAVILKPSELTPLTSLLMLDALRACGVPDSVFGVATGAAQTGEALIDEVDMVMFTGSTATGRKVMARAAHTLTPVSLELGGKDPMIVLADADLERAANAAVYYGMANAGQACISVERVYVESPVHDAFVDAVTRKVATLRQGPPDGPGSVDVGAMTSPEQVAIVSRHVEEARAAGARVTTGGEVGPGPGSFYRPTVLADVTQDMSAVREETFGPTLPILRVGSAEEAVRLANDSEYGLGASVWTGDLARGEALARRLESGAVCVNDAQVNYLALELPMGGWKASGLGVRHGAAGIRKYTRQQAILVTRFKAGGGLHMFPYRKRTTRLLSTAVKLLYGRRRAR